MSDTKLLINTIYLACEGEGVHIGHPQIFIRVQGCPIGCLNCDSKETWSFNSGRSLFLQDVIDKVAQLGNKPLGNIKRVSITGGDPLHPKHEKGVWELIKILKSLEYYINIEAAGTRVVPSIFDLIDYISFDFKTPSTGVTTRLESIIQMCEKYPHKFQVKSVIEDQKDFQYTLKHYLELKELSFGYEKLFPWCLTPAYTPGVSFSIERVKEIFQWNLESGGPFRVIGQQHKWFYGPDEKDV